MLLRLLRLHLLLLLLLGLSIPSKCIEKASAGEAKRTLNRSSKWKHLRSWTLRQRRGHHRPAEAPDRYIQLSPRSIRVQGSLYRTPTTSKKSRGSSCENDTSKRSTLDPARNIRYVVSFISARLSSCSLQTERSTDLAQILEKLKIDSCFLP